MNQFRPPPQSFSLAIGCVLFVTSPTPSTGPGLLSPPSKRCVSPRTAPPKPKSPSVGVRGTGLLPRDWVRGRLTPPPVRHSLWHPRQSDPHTPSLSLHRSAATILEVEDRVREAGPGRALRQGAGWVRDGGRENTVALCLLAFSPLFDNYRDR
ncbi:hypothetical protein EDB80DRAFT_727230 [Ilyonectria destructans]|nr:hypothetical protein EDB80DRAFT_727230 [Ilyonectria destructans]